MNQIYLHQIKITIKNILKIEQNVKYQIFKNWDNDRST